MTRLQKALSELPRSADEIALKFLSEGVKGRRRTPWACPISNYLSREGCDCPLVSSVAAHIVKDNGDLEFVDLPKDVRVFVSKFDEGDYQELVAQ